MMSGQQCHHPTTRAGLHLISLLPSTSLKATASSLCYTARLPPRARGLRRGVRGASGCLVPCGRGLWWEKGRQNGAPMGWAGLLLWDRAVDFLTETQHVPCRWELSLTQTGWERLVSLWDPVLRRLLFVYHQPPLFSLPIFSFDACIAHQKQNGLGHTKQHRSAMEAISYHWVATAL